MTTVSGSYEVRLLHEATDDPERANIDVVVEFASDRRFGATFFTVDNIRWLLDQYTKSGECAHGLYVWASDMIIIRRLSDDAIKTAVADLIQTGEFDKAFRELT